MLQSSLPHRPASVAHICKERAEDIIPLRICGAAWEGLFIEASTISISEAKWLESLHRDKIMRHYLH